VRLAEGNDSERYTADAGRTLAPSAFPFCATKARWRPLRLAACA
jgi:hypothetical protein